LHKTHGAIAQEEGRVARTRPSLRRSAMTAARPGKDWIARACDCRRNPFLHPGRHEHAQFDLPLMLVVGVTCQIAGLSLVRSDDWWSHRLKTGIGRCADESIEQPLEQSLLCAHCGPPERTAPREERACANSRAAR
jgi:hypothetical protein